MVTAHDINGAENATPQPIDPIDKGRTERNKNTMNTMQRRYVRELLNLNNDIRGYDDIGAEAAIALQIMDASGYATADFERFIEIVDAFIKKIISE
jgi:hypothetical protein